MSGESRKGMDDRTRRLMNPTTKVLGRDGDIGKGEERETEGGQHHDGGS